MSRVGILLSGGGTNAQALIDACASGAVPAQIAVVISNRRSAGGLDRARAAGIPAVHIGHRQFDTREAFDQALTASLVEHGVDWVACAGFMRLLTPTFLDAWPGRVLNIHPALLPAFPGIDGQGQAHDYGVRIAGCTVHFVDAGTDTGAIIAQGAVPVRAEDDRDAVQQRILAVEHRLYPMVLKMAVEGRLELDGRHVRVDLRPGESLSMWASD